MRTALLVGLAAALGAGCSLLTSTSGLTGAGDGQASASAPPGDGGPAPEAGGVVASSCAALPAGTPDGPQLLDPDGPGPKPAFQATCDMTRDEGGWMLVTPEMLGEESGIGTTVTRRSDARGGAVLRAYVNLPGCGSGPRSDHRIVVRDVIPWTRIRFRQSFAGRASCWHVFGFSEDTSLLDANLLPFSKTTDTIRDQVRSPANFWSFGEAELRAATVILRRREPTAPAALVTGADCGSFGAGTASPTFWEYSETG